MKSLIEVNDKTKEDIERVKKYALNNPYCIIDGAIEKGIIPGDNSNHVIYINNLFRIVYSIDVFEGIAYHHLSISKIREEIFSNIQKNILSELLKIKSNTTNLPEIPEAEEILKLFGIESDINDLYNVYYEANLSAINLVKKIDIKK